MPAISTTGNRAAVAKPKKRPVAKAPAKPRASAPPQSPDSRDNNTAAKRPKPIVQPSPDAQDVGRSSQQKARDRAAVATTVKAERTKAVVAGRQARVSHALGSLINDLKPSHNAVAFGQAPKRGGKGAPSGDVGATIGASKLSVSAGALTRAPLAVAIAFHDKPAQTTKATLAGARDMLVGLVPGIVKTVIEPRATAKGIAANYAHRYGGLNEPGGVARMAKRVEKEGAAPEFADLTSLGVPIGKVADEALGAAARAGKLGEKAEAAANRVRPAIRTTGGAAKAQETPTRLSGVIRTARKDANAGRTVQRTASKADEAARATAVKDVEGAGKTQPLTDPRPVKGKIDAVVREAADRGEVVPTRLGGRQVSYRKIGKAQVHDYASAKGRSLIEQRGEQRTDVQRGLNKTTASLNPDERRGFKIAMELGITHRTSMRQASDAVYRHIVEILHNRQAGHDIPGQVDELPLLHRMVEDPQRYFTPQLAKVTHEEMLRGARVGEGDPGLGRTATERAAAAEARRLKPQAETLAVHRGGQPIEDAQRAGAETTRARRQSLAKSAAARDRAVRRADALTGYAQAGVDRAKGSIDKQIAREARVVRLHERAAANWRRREAVARQDHTRLAHGHAAAAAEERAVKARARLAALKGNKDALRPEYRKVVQRARGRAANATAAADRDRDALRAAGEAERSLRRQKKAGTKLLGAEPLADFHARARGVARDRGLGEPGYFPSRKRADRAFSPFTIGGARRVAGPKHYEGDLYRVGRESNSLGEYGQAIAQNIKRKHNWKLVRDTIEAHTFPWGNGLKYGEIKDALDAHGIDPRSVKIVDMDAFLDGAKAASAETPGWIGPAEGGLYEALHGALTTPDKADAVADLQKGAGRLLVLPKDVADELEADTKPSGWLGRGLDVVKGKTARIMLGLSPAWLQFQVGANVIQTLLGTKALPHEWVYANLKWWRGLSAEQEKALEPYMGIGSFHDSVDQVHIGAASQSDIVNTWRAMKEHPFWHQPRKALRGASVSQLNPLDVLFRLDNLQNNFFRKAVLYNALKKQAYDSMGKSMVDFQRSVDRILGTGPGLGIGKSSAPAASDALAAWMGPKDQIAHLIGNQREIEKAAEAVKDFLGDYQTYTSRERRIFSRNTMFYGYLRWSLRFAFYTMPVKHPVMTALLGQLGQINTNEVRDLLGGDELPYSLGKLYFTSGGKLKAIDLSRANPALNAVTQALAFNVGQEGVVRSGIASAIGVLPPVYGAILDAGFGKSGYNDRDLKVDSETTARPNKQGQALTDSQTLEIIGKDLLDLAAPYRGAENVVAGGRPLSDNSLLFRQRYTAYKDPAIRASVQQARNSETTGQRILGQVVPLIPQPNDDPTVAARIRRARGVAAPATGHATAAQQADTDAAIASYGGAAAAAGPSQADIDAMIKSYGG